MCCYRIPALGARSLQPKHVSQCKGTKGHLICFQVRGTDKIKGPMKLLTRTVPFFASYHILQLLTRTIPCNSAHVPYLATPHTYHTLQLLTRTIPCNSSHVPYLATLHTYQAATHFTSSPPSPHISSQATARWIWHAHYRPAIFRILWPYFFFHEVVLVTTQVLPCKCRILLKTFVLTEQLCEITGCRRTTR